MTVRKLEIKLSSANSLKVKTNIFLWTKNLTTNTDDHFSKQPVHTLKNLKWKRMGVFFTATRRYEMIKLALLTNKGKYF